MLDLQQKLKRTIIFVSHDLDEAFKIGNRIALMEGGRIVQCGTAREIIANPASDYVQEFVAHMNPLGVLTARDVMQPGSGRRGPATVAPDDPGPPGDGAPARRRTVVTVVEDGAVARHHPPGRADGPAAQPAGLGAGRVRRGRRRRRQRRRGSPPSPPA